MYAKYKIDGGVGTEANVLSDIVAILTGETDKNNLSVAHTI